MGRAILTTSALVLFAFGGVALFGADELARAFLGRAAAGEAVVQIGAAGMLGFAVLNWMSRANRIGGIYMRPLALGNSLFFVVVGLALGRALRSGQLPSITIAPTLVFAGLALAFGWLAFGHDPLHKEASPS